MTRERLYLYDTTLRDGQQSQGVDFSVEDKLRVAAALDAPRASTMSRAAGRGPTRPTARSSRRRPTLARASLTAFGMTKRAGRSAANDEVLAAVVNAGTPAVCLVGKTHDFHVRDRARASRSRRTSPTSRDVDRASWSAQGPRGDLRRRAFLRRLQGQPRLRARLPQGGAATPARAGWCSATPTAARCRPRSGAITGAVIAAGIPGERLGIHTHDDTGNAVANTLAAIDAGRAAGAGHAERARRALRQRQPRQPDPDAAAEGALCQPVRDRRQRRRRWPS